MSGRQSSWRRRVRTPQGLLPLLLARGEGWGEETNPADIPATRISIVEIPADGQETETDTAEIAADIVEIGTDMKEITGCSVESRIAFMETTPDGSEIATDTPETGNYRKKWSVTAWK